MRDLKVSFFILLIIAVITHGEEDKKSDYKGFVGVKEVIAEINPTAGNNAAGTVHFYRAGNKVKVVANISGLTPNGKHGFHIHQYGDCSSGDGKSAGGHYNPAGHNHAGPDDKIRHAGDLGNLMADENGNASYEKMVGNITIAGKKNPVLGRGIIIHAGADDLKSQPTGAAGARIGCGIIGIVKSE